jgi:predicted transcriptional regulator
MTIEISSALVERLRSLARQQGKQLQSVIEEAFELYLQDAAITDLEDGAAAEAQMKLVGELKGISPWSDEP